MKITVEYDASVCEAMGCSTEQLDTHASTLSGLRDKLVACGEIGGEALQSQRPARMDLDKDHGTRIIRKLGWVRGAAPSSRDRRLVLARWLRYS